MNLTYVTALCFRPSHVSSVQFTNKSAPARYTLSSFTTIFYLTIQPEASTHQRPSECPIEGINRSLPCFPQGAKGNLMGVWDGEARMCFLFICLALFASTEPAQRLSDSLHPHTEVCVFACIYMTYYVCIAHTQPQTLHTQSQTQWHGKLDAQPQMRRETHLEQDTHHRVSATCT